MCQIVKFLATSFFIFNFVFTDENQNLNWNFENILYPKENFHQQFPDATIGSNGIIHVVWVEQYGNQKSIQYSRSNSDGVNFSQPIQINSTNNNIIAYSQSGPKIRAYGNRIFIIFMMSNSSNYESIYLSTSEDNGDTWTQEIEIGSPDQRNVYPDFEIDLNGMIHLVNYSFHHNWHFEGVFYRSFFPDSLNFSIPILIDIQSNELKYFNQNYFYNNWNKINKEYFLLNYNLPDENIENFRLFQRIKNNIENNDLSEITNKYNFENIFVVIFYKNKKNLQIFSKISFSNSNFKFNLNQKNINYEDNEILDQIILNLKNLYEDKWKLINKINTSISIPIKISVKNSNFIISEKLENILNNSDFVYEYEIEKISSEDIIYKITYNNNPEKFLNTLKVNDININSSSNIWNIE